MENTFSKRLKESMLNKDITQTDLVKETGISKSIISEYLSGMYEAKKENLIKIAKALDVDPLWLIGEKDIGSGLKVICERDDNLALIANTVANKLIKNLSPNKALAVLDMAKILVTTYKDV